MTSSTTRAFMAKKQSTSFTQVATNLLNVLQGYSKSIRFVAVLSMLLIVGIGQAWGAETTVTWTAASGALGNGVGTGNIKTGSYSWNYTRTLISGSSYTAWSSNCIQLGKNGGVENITFTTSAIPGTIKNVSIECASYQGKHNVAITVGGKSYLSSTATSSWTTVSAKSASGTSSGTIQISLTGGSRALYIKSISVTYEENSGSGATPGSGENGTVTMTAGTNGSTCTVNGIEGIKVGTSSKGGDMSITIPAGATMLHIYAAAWNNVNGLSLTITPNDKVTIPSIALKANSGIANNSPFTLSGNEHDYQFDIPLQNITTETTLKFTSSSAKRFVVWGATYETSTGTTQPSRYLTPKHRGDSGGT